MWQAKHILNKHKNVTSEFPFQQFLSIAKYTYLIEREHVFKLFEQSIVGLCQHLH